MHSPKRHKMMCGCEFDIIDSKIKPDDGLPTLKIDYTNLRDCPKVWNMLSKGDTKGVFQLETSTGEQWASKAKPNSIDEVSALLSIIRPGVLKSLLNNKSLAEHYTDRKNNGEHIEYISEHLEPILSGTYGILTFQEQAILIVKELAGFTPGEAELFRKSVGKKSKEIMAEIKPPFIEGCKKVGKVTEEQADIIFSWLQESANYLFNASHAVSYSKLAYATAYMKCHFPLQFFTSSLYWAKEKIDEKEEISELVYESKKFDIDICPPSLKSTMEGKFGFNIRDKKIFFGLSNVKSIGESACKKFQSVVMDAENLIGKSVLDFKWIEFLIFIAGDSNKNLIENSISVGFLDHFKVHRKKLLFEYDIWSKVNENEQNTIKTQYKTLTSIEDCLDLLVSLDKKLGGPKTEKRRKLLADLRKLCQNPPFVLYDNRESIASSEKELLGVCLTASSLDGSDTTNADTTCLDFNRGKTGSCSIACVITRVNEYTIKKGKQIGQKMGALSAQDDSDKISSILIFADAWEANKDKLYTGARVILHGQKSKQNDSFLVSKVRSI